jgi:acyl carrier protein
METTKAKVRAFLSRFFRKHELQDDEDIFALGFVNSLFAMQLVMFIEKEFAVKVENSDLDFANFRSINAIAEFVHAKVAC